MRKRERRGKKVRRGEGGTRGEACMGEEGEAEGVS